MASARSCCVLAGLLLGILLNFSNALDEEYLVPHRENQRVRRAVTAPLRVTSILHEPYLLRKTDQHDQFEGFVVDILDELSERAGLEYHITLSADGKYGSRDSSGQWNGMIGEIVNNRADIAAAALTMTATRKEAVHFLHPFQQLGLTIVAQKPAEDTSGPMGHLVSSFRIMAPMDVGVWAVCVLAFLVVSGLLWLMNRFNPYEWRGRYNLGHATQDEADTFNVSGALWFTFTTLQWQGFDRAPRSIGARLLSVFWFVFVSITLITYTGAIVNNLFWASTVHSSGRNTLPFRDLEELAMHPDYKVGVISGGSSFLYLTKIARGPEFDYLREYFNGEGAENLVGSTADGLQRCRDDKYYAFVMESAFARYSVNQQPCDLTTAGEPFAKKSYGMPYRKDLDQSLVDALHIGTLQMIEEGLIEAMENKWFNHGACWNVTKFSKLMQFSQLQLNKPKTVDLHMFWAPLVMLLCGVLIAIMASIGEGLFFKMRGQYNPRNRPGGRKLAVEEDM